MASMGIRGQGQPTAQLSPLDGGTPLQPDTRDRKDVSPRPAESTGGHRPTAPPTTARRPQRSHRRVRHAMGSYSTAAIERVQNRLVSPKLIPRSQTDSIIQQAHRANPFAGRRLVATKSSLREIEEQIPAPPSFARHVSDSIPHHSTSQARETLSLPTLLQAEQPERPENCAKMNELGPSQPRSIFSRSPSSSKGDSDSSSPCSQSISSSSTNCTQTPNTSYDPSVVKSAPRTPKGFLLWKKKKERLSRQRAMHELQNQPSEQSPQSDSPFDQEGPAESPATEDSCEGSGFNQARGPTLLVKKSAAYPSNTAPAQVAEGSSEDVRSMTPTDHFVQGRIRWKDWREGEVIGSGTFGQVCLGLDVVKGGLVAVKKIVIPEDEREDLDKISMLREIELMRELDHPNIVKYLGAMVDTGWFHIFLEFIPGGSIASLLQKFGPFPDELVKSYLRQVCEGLSYLHGKGIIHRDIKGANLLVDQNGIAKLADFGCSKQLQCIRSVSLEASANGGNLNGSVPWMAPEVIKDSMYGKPSDVWSVGATIVEMATGSHPWTRYNNNLALLMRIASLSEPPEISAALSSDVKSLVESCLQVSVHDRATISQLKESLTGLSSSTHPSEGTSEQPLE